MKTIIPSFYTILPTHQQHNSVIAQKNKPDNTIMSQPPTHSCQKINSTTQPHCTIKVFLYNTFFILTTKLWQQQAQK